MLLAILRVRFCYREGLLVSLGLAGSIFLVCVCGESVFHETFGLIEFVAGLCLGIACLLHFGGERVLPLSIYAVVLVAGHKDVVVLVVSTLDSWGAIACFLLRGRERNRRGRCPHLVYLRQEKGSSSGAFCAGQICLLCYITSRSD